MYQLLSVLLLLLSLSQAIVINEPVEIAGYYDTLRAAFSAPAPEYLNAQLVYAQPASGCSVPTNNVTGKIVIFDAGLCVQITIAQNLLAAGAAAGLSNFNSPTLLNVYSSATFGSVNIPFYYISSTAVSIIKPFIQNGTYVTATLGYQPSPTTHVNALLDFYAATGGTTSWRFGLSGQFNAWTLTNGHPCQVWYGIVCNDLTGEVYGVVLTSNVLSGTIPNSFGSITTLRKLNLPSATLSGTIPESIWQLTEMRQLVVSSNQLSGTISPSIAGMTKLQLLELDNNAFSGTIPTEIGSLTKLTIAQLNVNSFSGTVPASIGACTLLTSLVLAQNKLTGAIPSGVANMLKLTTLDLSRNGFSGNLPDLSGILGLQTLDISYNLFNGPLPPLLGNLVSLIKLSVTNNSLSGSIPSISGLTKLVTLDLSHNQFSGTLGGSTVLPTTLTQLTASNNQFSSIGTDFSNLKALSILDLSYNKINSIIVMQYLPKVTSTDILAGKNGLVSINLAHNLMANVTLDVELPISGFPSITTLDLSNNQLAGALAYLTSPSLNPFLTTIDLSNNLLTGTVPPGFGGLTALRTLNLLSNRMHYAGSALLPPFITPDYDSTTVNTTGNFYCPKLLGTQSDVAVQLDNSYHDFLLCYCNAGFRRNPRATQLDCLSCPDHLKCPGGTLDALSFYEAGYFPTPNIENPLMMLPCTSCQKEDSLNFTCQPGYDNRLCSQCEPGYFLQSKQCIECGAGGGYALFAAIIIIVVLVIVFFSLAFTKMGLFEATPSMEFGDSQSNFEPRTTPAPPSPPKKKTDAMREKRGNWCFGLVRKLHLAESRAIILIVINYAQTLSILSKYLPVNLSLKGILGALDIANITAGGFGAECLNPAFSTTYARYLFSALQPAAVTIFFLLIYLAGTFLLKAFTRDATWWKNVCMRCMLFILDFLFFPVILACIAIFSCTPDPVTHLNYITKFPFTLCSEIPEGLKVIMLILQLAIMFVFAGLLIYFKFTKHPKTQLAIFQRFGFFFQDFRSRWFFVGVIIMCRRLIFSLLNGLLDVEALQLFFANEFTILISLMFFYSVRPYKSSIDNYLEILSHVSLLLCYGVIYGGAIYSGDSGDLVSNVFIVWNALLFVLMLAILICSKMPNLGAIVSYLRCDFARSQATEVKAWRNDEDV